MVASGGAPVAPRLAHRLWIERPRFLALIRRRSLVGSIAFISYGFGLFLASLSGSPHYYLESPAFILGALGIGWVFGSIRTRARIADRLYADLQVIFTLDQASYYAHIEHHFARVCAFRPQLVVTCAFLVLNAASGILAFYGPQPLVIFGEQIGSVRPWIFQDDIYRPPTSGVYFVVVMWFALAVSLMLGTSAWLLLRELVLVRSLSTLPIIPIANAVRTSLKPLADFHVRVAIDWSIGALLFYLLFLKTPDILSAALIASLIVIGVAVLVGPQFLLTDVVRRSHEKACIIAIDDFQRRFSVRSTNIIPIDYIADVATATERPRFWVYSPDELLRWLAAQLVALVALYEQIQSIK